MYRTTLFLTIAIGLLTTGCESQSAQLSDQDVRNYLDGRPLVVPEQVLTGQPVAALPGDKVVSTATTGQPVTMTARTLIINKANISNLALGKPEKGTEMTWTVPVTFVYTDGVNADAVAAVVEYSVNSGRAVFLGFRIVKVAKQ
jgi:hypothetical protein